VCLRGGDPSSEWAGLTLDDSPLMLHETSFREIYALDLQLPLTKFRRDSACCLIIDLVVVGSGLTTADEWSATLT